MDGARVTDVIDHYQRKGERRAAVRTVRHRSPDGLRWRSAVGKLTATAGRLRGMDRMKIEEPVREVVVDLDDRLLRREVVIDARRHNVDFDRGEILPFHRMGDLRTYAHLTHTDIRLIERYVTLPEDFDAPVDGAAVIIVARALANQHRRRAQRLWLEIPDEDGPERLRLHHKYMAERAKRDAEIARRWSALATTIVGK